MDEVHDIVNRGGFFGRGILGKNHRGGMVRCKIFSYDCSGFFLGHRWLVLVPEGTFPLVTRIWTVLPHRETSQS